jgi:hypothetical protein
MNTFGPRVSIKNEPRCLDMADTPWPVRFTIRLGAGVVAEITWVPAASHGGVRRFQKEAQ